MPDEECHFNYNEMAAVDIFIYGLLGSIFGLGLSAVIKKVVHYFFESHPLGLIINYVLLLLLLLIFL